MSNTRADALGQMHLRNFIAIHLGKEPVLEHSELSKLAYQLNEEGIDTFNKYLKLSNQIQLMLKNADSYISNYKNAITELNHQLLEAELLLETDINEYRQPIILTQSQYEELLESSHFRKFNGVGIDAEDTKHTLTLWELVFRGILTYAIEYIEEIEQGREHTITPLTKVKEAYQQEPLEEQDLIDYCLTHKELLDNGKLPTKWGFILKAYNKLDEVYPASKNNNLDLMVVTNLADDSNTPAEAEYLAQLTKFYCAFTDLVKYILEDIEEKTHAPLSKVQLPQWQSILFGFEMLYNYDVYNFKASIDLDFNLFDYDRLVMFRALSYGVAIIKDDNPLLKLPIGNIDEQGHYKEHKALSNYQNGFSILSYKLTDDYKSKAGKHYALKYNAIKCLRQCIKHNEYIEALANAYKVDEFRDLLIDIEDLTKRLKAYNKLSYKMLVLLALCYEKGEVYTAETNLELQAIVLNIFTDFDIEKITKGFIPQEATTLLQDNVKNFGTLGHINILNNYFSPVNVTDFEEDII